MKINDFSFNSTDLFLNRHIGPSPNDVDEMLKTLEVKTLQDLINSTIPEQIRLKNPLLLPTAISEFDLLAELRNIASENQVFRSFIGMGYSDCITPAVIQRNILENPGWYTQYTPYQAEIAQGRLEALLNFQTMISDLTALPIANASLLDEATAAAEAMVMAFNFKGRDLNQKFFVSKLCHPQTIAVLATRAKPLGIKLVIGDHEQYDFKESTFGVLLQYPTTDGIVCDYRSFIECAHAACSLVVMSADLLALTLITPPGELGADIAIGSTQRFGVPLGFGGPHAAYLSTKDEFKRITPGRIVGVSQDVNGKPAIRLALQTREQHIRREKATSNICTAQVLLAIMASMYAVYHGPKGLKKIALRIHHLAEVLRRGLNHLGFKTGSHYIFDTVKVTCREQEVDQVLKFALRHHINIRKFDEHSVCIALDETTSFNDVKNLIIVFAFASTKKVDDLVQELDSDSKCLIPENLFRKSLFLTHPVFNSYHSETEMLRYIHRLQNKDLSLTFSMTPLGSCTMKLNGTSEMFPISWPEFSKIHPFAPKEQTVGYLKLIHQLEQMLAEITGFSAVSVQPNAGSQGEYAGLLVIRAFYEKQGKASRDVCLIPKSAHGTNPASAAMAGMKIVIVDCDSNGNIDITDLRLKAEANKDHLAVLMITYPSTHGVFEEGVVEVCKIVHDHGGQVYMDGANMNAQVGLCRPGDFGPDVCHLNLHKTFAIPHGGGGPGMGTIAVKSHLSKFLPTHPIVPVGFENGIGPVSAAPWGSAGILPISWMYIRLMGTQGLKIATEIAILNANYIAKRLSPYYPVLYRGYNGFVAHECIFDFRSLKEASGIEVEDVAKRLMDYGFHAPTISFPVVGTIMVEPTESESKVEIDRFCEAMILIHEEITEVINNKADRMNNLLKNAPHTVDQVVRAEWNRPYTRERAVFPTSWTRQNKFWPSVGRINNVLGDRNLICTCPSIETYHLSTL